MNKRRLFLLLGLIAFAFLVFANFGRLDEFMGDIRKARWYILALLIPVQLIGYLFTAKFYQKFTSLFAPKAELKHLYRMSLAINFVNQAFPSGGVSAVPYMNSQMDKVPTGKVTLTHIVRFMFTYISFTVILLSGFFILLLSGNVSATASRLTLGVVLAITIGSILAFMIMSNKQWLTMVSSWAAATANWFNKLVLRRKKKAVTRQNRQNFVAEFHEGFAILQEEPRRWLKPLAYTFGTNITEVLTVYVVCLSFGLVINPGIVIAAYTLANLVSVLAVVTGGVGLFEATMIGMFVAFGVPVTLATAIVIVYRVLNFAIFLPLGFYFYNRTLGT